MRAYSTPLTPDENGYAFLVKKRGVLAYTYLRLCLVSIPTYE